MKNLLKLSALFIIMVTFQSCTKEPTLLDKIADELKVYTNANETQLTTKGIEGFVNDNSGAYILTISDSPLIDNGKRSGSLLTSMCAKMIFDRLPADEQKKGRKVHAIIESKGKFAHYYYNFKDLATVAPFLEASTAALAKIKAKKYEEAYAAFDHKMVDEEAYKRYIITPIIQDHGDIFFNAEKTEVTGFKYADMKGKNTIIVYNRLVHHGKEVNFKTTHYKREAPSIILIGFN